MLFYEKYNIQRKTTFNFYLDNIAISCPHFHFNHPNRYIAYDYDA
jgi:hypothetical protein